MADSSCSGSTPFKSLVEHGAEDRTLHRDRFARASGTQQAFRSTGLDPSAQAQAHFGAFLVAALPSTMRPALRLTLMSKWIGGWQLTETVGWRMWMPLWNRLREN
ncbi:hypothetical protein CH35J_000621 [Colletotrichum higginsianum]|uniref:Uncharacterized protein n=1 Tax=Colletotrichum higginsianum TaxID=80884 RepID=A0A4T0WLE9_9PEZI|nr:hypothetical protein CH35J_000621 [Colletotrichum higginsianum]